MKTQEEYDSIEEIRKSIDSVDKEIIELIGLRAKYINEIVKYKISKDLVEDKTREKEMLVQRKKWARMNNIDEDFIERLYKYICKYFVNEQKNKL